MEDDGSEGVNPLHDEVDETLVAAIITVFLYN